MPSITKPRTRTGDTRTGRKGTLIASVNDTVPVVATETIQDASALPPAQTGAAIHGPSLLFDPDWYRGAYPDVAQAGIDPIRHYFDDGAREGRDPNPFFSTSSYVGRYDDVAASRMNPFLHYLLYGAREGRTPGV